MIVRSPAGVTVITVGDALPVGGYSTTSYDEGSRGWDRITTDSPYVDGTFEVARKRGKARLTWSVLVQGSSLADTRTKYRALLTAVEVDRWLLDVTGDNTTTVWVCDVPDSEVRHHLGGLSREVTFSIPAQPADGY